MSNQALLADLPSRQAHILVMIELGYLAERFRNKVATNISWKGRKQNG
jgi:hypothetical protein